MICVNIFFIFNIFRLFRLFKYSVFLFYFMWYCQGKRTCKVLMQAPLDSHHLFSQTSKAVSISGLSKISVKSNIKYLKTFEESVNFEEFKSVCNQ